MKSLRAESRSTVYKQRYWDAQPDHCSLRMETQWIFETSEVFKRLTWPSAHEDFIQKEALLFYLFEFYLITHIIS